MYNNLDLYLKKIEHNNMIYSVDKIRLKTYINYQDFKELEFFVNTYFKDKIKKFWVSDQKSAFHYNYNIEVGEGRSFIFQFMHNSETINYNKDNKLYNFSIEFNPNKLGDDFIILHILNSFGNWLLRSFDLAIDIPVSILDIIFDKGKKHKAHIISDGGDKMTCYIGTKDKDGSIKIYNKKVESKLNIVGELTRVEISRKYEDFPIAAIKSFDFGDQFFPWLTLNQYVTTFSDVTTKDTTLLAILYAVQHGFSLNDLSRRYREKVKEMFEGGSRIRFDRNSATQAFRQLIFHYFVRRESKQIIM